MDKTTSFVIYDQTTHTFYRDVMSTCYSIYGANHFSSREVAQEYLVSSLHNIKLMPDMVYAEVVMVETRLID